MSEQIMDVRQVAKYLGVSKATIYKWVEYKKIPYTKVGTLLRFPKWLIDRHLAQKAVYPDEDLYTQFEKLAARYHLKQFLRGQGLDIDQLSTQQIRDELERALRALRAAGSKKA